ncbi:2-dehydropantoate 2-reductase [Butyrivibrio sp. ob235]|uniref:ketopantoate reductase family protein n=1 Tax=Butyrivibrio sp. ob235 TaxID=1761780 RepID=UPI0008C5BFB8|nr:2-dehydropantoate 2-reductase N-terminal domain-containing protein [Butyrivibrio sp. ob235]SEM28040.1 2-dehydropantoate 2-reductase [Butyrivibrio sp. ob235]
MRILVYGAGVLGGNLANSLYRQGKELTLLARGKWYEEIKRNGLSIHHYFGRKTNVKIPVINELKSDDIYDVIFVVVRYTQVDSVVEDLNNNGSKNIVFVGNNLKTDELTKALSEKSVLFAFAMSAGHREKSYIRSVTLNKITVGNLKGNPSGEAFIRNVFSGTNFKVVYEPNMTDWLLCHAASVIPIAFACYYANGDIKKLKRDKAYINRIMDATIAAYAILEDNGHEIMPDSDKDFRNPKFKKKYIPFYQFIFTTKLGKLCTSDHAMNAIDEMSALNRDFKEYIEEYGDIPQAWIDLEKDTNGYLI